MQRTLEEELNDIIEYRSGDRRMFFFSTKKNSSIDGRYKSLGVEEKYNPLDLKEHLIDGSIHRGIVWVLGNPHNLAEPVESLSLYVVQENASPIQKSDVDLYFPIIYSLAKLNINIVFVNGLSGDHWIFNANELHKPLPKWLSEKEFPDVWDKKIDVITSQNQFAMNILQNSNELEKRKKQQRFLPGFGKKGEYQEIEISSDSKAAIIDYGNEWRLIELGLILRSAGYDAVKAIYNKC